MNKLASGVDGRQPVAELVGEVVAGAPRAVALDERSRAEVFQTRAGTGQWLAAAIRAGTGVLNTSDTTHCGCTCEPKASFKGRGGLEGSTDPRRIYDFKLFHANRAFETVLLLHEQYFTETETPKITETPNNLLKRRHWRELYEHHRL